MNRFINLILVFIFTIFSCASINVNPHHGPIYCVLSQDASVIRQEIEDVINEFNSQLGYNYFDSKGSFDILVFHVMPDDTVWPNNPHGKITALAYYNIVILRNDMIINSDYVRQLLVHEIGHVLGLKHSNDITNVMYPYIKIEKLMNFKHAISQVIKDSQLIQIKKVQHE